MAKVKKAYFCKECGYEAPKWMGRCPACGEWNSFTEEIVARESGSVPAAMTSALPRSTPQRVGEIRSNDRPRLDLGNAEVNRVLGGGLVPGSLVLLGGEPGIGKSTLSLQIALADNGLKTLYVSGEESAEQIKMRADRIGIGNDACMVYSETLLENIMAQLEEQRPDLVIIDSIQTIYTDLVESSAGSVSQIRECAATLLKYAKGSGTSIFIIGHITKEGAIAGPKILEHIVDVVLQFEGDSNQVYRILRGIKNRFGATFEIGVFEMLDAGLRPVDNPSEILLTHYDAPLSGIAVGASVDGMRPYLIEVQALVSNAAYGTPQRTATGFDYKRMSMLLAVLEKRVGMKMYHQGRLPQLRGRLQSQPIRGSIWRCVAAVISSYYDRPIAEGRLLRRARSASRARCAPHPAPNSASARRRGWASGESSYRAIWPRARARPKGIEVVGDHRHRPAAQGTLHQRGVTKTNAAAGSTDRCVFRERHPAQSSNPAALRYLQPTQITVDTRLDLRLVRLLPHGLRFEMIRQRLHAGLVLAAAQPQVLVGRGERRLGQPDFELRFVEVVRRLRRFELQQLAAVETLRLRLLEPRPCRPYLVRAAAEVEDRHRHLHAGREGPAAQQVLSVQFDAVQVRRNCPPAPPAATARCAPGATARAPARPSGREAGIRDAPSGRRRAPASTAGRADRPPPRSGRSADGRSGGRDSVVASRSAFSSPRRRFNSLSLSFTRTFNTSFCGLRPCLRALSTERNNSVSSAW